MTDNRFATRVRTAADRFAWEYADWWLQVVSIGSRYVGLATFESWPWHRLWDEYMTPAQALATYMAGPGRFHPN